MWVIKCKAPVFSSARQSCKPFFRSSLPDVLHQVQGNYSRADSSYFQNSCNYSCGCKLWDVYPKNSNYRSHSLLSNLNLTVLLTTNREIFMTSPTFDEPSSITNQNDTKTRIRSIDEVIYHLQTDLKRKRRIHKADIHNAIELVEEASRVENFGTFLLNCLCDILPDLHPTYRVKLAERIWTVIQKSKEYSTAHSESMLKILALNEDKSADPVKLLKESKSFGANTSGTMYFFALLIVCQRGDLEAAVEILKLMKENMVPVNERFFNALMIGNARAGDVKAATDILEIMRASKIEPSIHTWNTLLHIYIETENLQELEKTFSATVESSLTEDQFYELLKAAGRQTNPDVLNSVIRFTLESRKMHTLSFMNLTLQLMHLGHAENALKILVEFSETLKSNKEFFGAFFIRKLISADINMDANTYMKLITSLQEQNLNPFTLNIAAESCLKHNKLDLASRIYEAMHAMNIPVRPHYYLPAFISESNKIGLSGSLSVLRQMQALNVQPDWEMLSSWIIPIFYELEGDLLEVLKTVKENSGLSYTSGSIISAGLTFALQEKKLKEGAMVVEKIKGKLSHPEEIMNALLGYICDMDGKKELNDTIKFIKYVSDNKHFQDKKDYVGAFILKLLECDRSEEAELLMKSIGTLQIPISATAADILKDKINFNDELVVDPDLSFQYVYTGSRKHMVHVSEMDETGLECHKQELESKDMNARGTTRKLFLKYCARGDLEKALKTKNRFEKEYGSLSLGMKSSLMSSYVQNKRLEPALELFHELINADDDTSPVKLDVYKIIDLATLMARKGLMDEAVSVVKKHCQSRTIDRPESIMRNIINFLEALSQVGSEDVYTVTQLFLKLRFINPTNPTLGPSIRDLIRKQKLEAAVERFEKYTQQFSINPCLQELTYAVIDTPDLLERVLICSTTTKGEREAKRLLALARADLGDIDGAAAGFVELGNDLSFMSIIKQCEYLSSRREVDKVLNLINALHKTERNYDCKKLYDIAIQGCKRFGDNDGLKRILCRMEEKDVYISQTLKELSSQM